MELSTVTSTTLLAGLRNPGNRTLWTSYVERYRPLLLAFLGRAGLSDADAEDVAQETLAAFAEAYRAGRYDRSRGRLRSWLYGIARNRMKGHLRNAPRERPVEDGGEGAGVLDSVPAAEDGELEQAWEEEWRRAVLRQGLAEVAREVEPETVRAFELFALAGRPSEEVAAELGTTVNAVYGSKRRVLRRLREVLPLLEDVF